MLVPNPRTWAAGGLVTAALLNTELRDALLFALGAVPKFLAVQGVTQAVGNGVWTDITFTSEVLDPDNGHSNSVNTARFTAQTAGYYKIEGIAAALMTAGPLAARIAKNGVAIVGSSASTTGTVQLSVAGVKCGYPDVFLNGTTDYVTLQMYQQSGGSVNTPVGTDFACMLSARRISS